MRRIFTSPYGDRHFGRVALALLALVLLVVIAALGWSTLLRSPGALTPAAPADGPAIVATP